jgi:hypothetical protein
MTRRRAAANGKEAPPSLPPNTELPIKISSQLELQLMELRQISKHLAYLTSGSTLEAALAKVTARFRQEFVDDIKQGCRERPGQGRRRSVFPRMNCTRSP